MSAGPHSSAGRAPRARPVEEIRRVLATLGKAGVEDLDVLPEELAGLRSADLGPVVLWVTPAWALRRRIHSMDRLTLTQAPWGITVEVMRMLQTDGQPAAAWQAFAFLGLIEQEVRAEHRTGEPARGTRLEIPRWTRLPRDVAHSWLMTVAGGDALDAYLAALTVDASAQRRALAALLASDREDALTPAYHRWEARAAAEPWGPAESLFDAVARHHGSADAPWPERRRLARVAIATGRVRQQAVNLGPA
ncbi:MAG TPA: hypothetical protein VFO66_10035 [Gemmatimonadaceae bacterium]|nr:hypothetical protein [Gemmatimonadaceae bacterium]